uniref:RNA-directed DNA polymerase n=1 Tax=Trichuris muris TaxID=70415 RepID=A0A5S6QWV2_TRIMR
MGHICGRGTELTIDTGAAVSLMSHELFNDIQPADLLPIQNVRLITAAGDELRVVGTSTVNISIGKSPPTSHTLLVAHSLTCPCLIGADFLRQHKCIIDFTSGTLQMNGYEVKLKTDRLSEHSIATASLATEDLRTYEEIIDSMCASGATENDYETREQLKKLFWKYKGVLPTTDDDLGRTSVVRHRIRTGNAKPIKMGPRRMPHRDRPIIQDLVDRMLQQGVIERASSPWSFPVVLAKKKNGSFRFCVDYRKLNDRTEKDVQPLPRIDDALDILSGSRWFSTLDLASGYWQVEVEPEDRPKTAFSTPTGSYQFRVMPFGLCNAPATFQRLMEQVLEGLQWKTCLVYLDDIIIFGRTTTEQMERLEEVLNRLQAAGLKVKPSKCKLMTQEVVFLGHVVSGKGISTDPLKCATVENWEPPRCTNELRQFIGLASYYRKFVKNFASIAAPLHRLLQKDKRWSWDDDCERAFQEMKRRLLTAPILKFPDFNKTFVLDVDASNDGLGAVLSQVHDDGEHPIAYASRALTKPERRYCATRRELLALVWASKHFRPYLYGTRFKVRTDHNCLIWLNNFREPEGQIARWLERLAEFDMEICHRPGKLHDNADALSRQTCGQCGKAVIPVAYAQAEPTQQQDQMNTAQNQDGDIKTLKEWIAQDCWPSSCPEGVSRELRIFWGQRNALILDNGTLFRLWETPNSQRPLKLLVVPSHMRREILEELHDAPAGGHLGERRTLEKARCRFYWPGMAKDIKLWCRTCDACACRKGPSRRSRQPLQSIQTGYPFQRVGIDFLGPLPKTTTGKRYVLVVVDYFTKWTEAYATENMEAKTVAKVLVDNFITRFGPPESVHSDQGRSFEATLLAETFQLLGIKKTHTTSYHPQSNGLVERFNRTLLDTLALLSKRSPETWDEMLPWTTFAYNTSSHDTTGTSPFLALFGREARLPVDLRYDLPQREEPQTVTAYVSDLRQKLLQVHTSIRRHAHIKQQRQKDY